ncbi:MtnX-like HAD-IB family phosphatase [Alkalihalobacterium bogoriense]|uniref:MtnX-like HAD-IB family phosphatase n=1 Tax=Alkalihalobacterium bogoriense TaxID=246272 RepID=UPI00047ED65A|nr:MtnX-like HAD-IB family phosphatase [Alkalihalobacterium bogoriense]
MKKWAFVSDFDGTISKEDFYWLVIKKYFEEGHDLFKKWKAEELLDIEFLQTVFSSIHQEEATIIEDIVSLQIDEAVPRFIRDVQRSGGDFYILSAGTDYYIKHILSHYGIENVDVISNKGYFHEKNIHLTLNENDPTYSKRYGIDKAKVIQQMKNEYETIYFFGDSEPDSHPAVNADVTFAKAALISILKEKEVPFVPVNDFNEVREYLRLHNLL